MLPALHRLVAKQDFFHGSCVRMFHLPDRLQACNRGR
jgi:hypothetical protein